MEECVIGKFCKNQQFGLFILLIRGTVSNYTIDTSPIQSSPHTTTIGARTFFKHLQNPENVGHPSMFLGACQVIEIELLHQPFVFCL